MGSVGFMVVGCYVCHFGNRDRKEISACLHTELRSSNFKILPAALREGLAYDENLPAKTAAYDLRLSQRWAIPKETTDLLTMRSRSIAAFALHRPIGGRRFAIIVFESMSTGSIDEDCRNRFTREEQDGIIQWLETMERF